MFHSCKNCKHSANYNNDGCLLDAGIRDDLKRPLTVTKVKAMLTSRENYFCAPARHFPYKAAYQIWSL